MGRIVTNKYKTNDIVTRQDFYNGIAVEDPVEKKRIAMGRIILTVKEGNESMWILNEHDVPKLVAEPTSVEVPANIREYIAEKVSEMGEEVKEYSNEFITESFTDFSQLVISSADTMYNELKGYIDTLSSTTESVANEINGRIDELSAYTMTMKSSDHFMITDIEYRMLSMIGELDGSNISNETYDLNGLARGSTVYYSDEIYYCIYEDSGGSEDESGSTIVVSGNTIEIQYVISGSTVILDDYATIEDEHTLVFLDGGGSGGNSDIDGSVFEIGSLDIEDEHTIILSGNYEIDENNTLVIN